MADEFAFKTRGWLSGIRELREYDQRSERAPRRYLPDMVDVSGQYVHRMAPLRLTESVDSLLPVADPCAYCESPAAPVEGHCRSCGAPREAA